jgi:hypothetical protein
MEVGQGPNWGCSAKEKKIRYLMTAFLLNENDHEWRVDKILS